jgi:hypothetical protein
MTQKRIFNLPIGAGLYTEQTERGAVGRWRYADKVRFRKGLAEKIGGWVRIEPQFLGVCRRLKDWSSLDAKFWSAVATDVKLYLWQDGSLYDITPLRDSGTLTDPFTTTVGTQIVQVTHVNHGAQLGDYVRFSGASVVGGVTVDGEYQVTSIIDTSNYTIVDDETASASANGGGIVGYEYDISAGAESVKTATGYGTGPYGREGYGNARTGSTLTIGIRTWSLDTWGEDLLACPRGGAIYWWDRSKGTGSRAVALGGDAPPNNEYMLVSQRDRHVLALGAYDYFNNAFDPLLIRWSSTEDLNDWVPTSTNTSGDLRLYAGSKIVCGVRSRLETVIFTDVSVHTLPFVGGSIVFGLNIVGENVSILGPNCAVPIDHRVLFMAEADFYMYDGVVRVVPCDVRNYVYENLNVQQRDKIYGGLNREFNEVWWFYPSYDPNSWVQQDFSLGLPTGFSLANGSNTPPNLYDDVLFQGDFEGSNGSTTYTEESSYAAVATFNGATQISTTSPILDTSSLDLGSAAVSEFVSFPIQTGDLPDWDGTGQYLTAEYIFRLDTLHSFGDKDICLVGDSDYNICRLAVNRSSGTSRLRAGFAQTGSLTPAVTINAGTNYVVIVEADYTGGAGNGVERIWFGEQGGAASLLSTNTGLTAKDPTILFTQQILFGGTSGLFGTDGHVDHVRITNSTTGRYGTAATVTIDDPYPTTSSPGGPADIGYVYAFDSSGFTERVPSAANVYEHDYFMTNSTPIITPLESEYAVEIDVNPNIAAGTGQAGVCFLRTDLVGTGNTHADDCQQFMVSLNYSSNSVVVQKKEGAAPTNPDNQVSNSVDFTTLTGSAMALGTKYIITVQYDAPQMTVWVDGNQAFQFNLSTAEEALFTSGTAGLHASPDTTGDQYRFYNFATGPVGTLTAADFDISPIEVNRYVAFNYEEGTWTTGKLSRTAWADRSPLLEKPYAASRDGYLYQHETGTDDNGAAMEAYIESFDMEIPEAGEELIHIDQLIPDFLELEGSVDVYLTGLKYPQDMNRISKGPYTVSPGTRKLSTRMRARQVALRVESDALGDLWRMGTWRGRGGPHGKRG